MYMSLKTYQLVLDRMKAKKAARSDLVFPRRDGSQLSDDAMRKRIARFMQSLNLGTRTHDLRHTAATKVYEETKDLVLLKDLMGHASTKTTQIYTHSTEEDKREAAAVLARLYRTSYDQ